MSVHLPVGTRGHLQLVKYDEQLRLELPPKRVDTFANPSVLGIALNAHLLTFEECESLGVQVRNCVADQIETRRKVVQHRRTRHAGFARHLLSRGAGVADVVEAVDGSIQNRAARVFTLGLLPRFVLVGRH